MNRLSHKLLPVTVLLAFAGGCSSDPEGGLDPESGAGDSTGAAVPDPTTATTSGAAATTDSTTSGMPPMPDPETTSGGSTGNDDDIPPPPIVYDVGGTPEMTGGVDDRCTGGDATTLQATIRDFASSHPDFEVFWGSQASTGLVLDVLGADLTPEYNPAAPFPPAGSSATQITSAATFADWYHDVAGTNVPVAIDIPLEEMPPGSGNFVFDDPTFFPIDNDGWNGAPGPNNETFPDTLGDPHNFHFTTEIHTSFVYSPGQHFTFIGDDDLWVFIDGILAIDLGGLHGELQGTVDLDTLGLVDGDTYEMDIFHAERRHDGSHFRVETSIDCFFPPAN